MALSLIASGIFPGTVHGQSSECRIKSLELNDRVDNDGDGFYSDFSVRIVLDTKCPGQYDGGLFNRELDIEPLLQTRLDGSLTPTSSDRFDELQEQGIIGPNEAENQDDLQIELGHVDPAIRDAWTPHTFRFNLRLYDNDAPLTDEIISVDLIDEAERTIEVESPREDVNHPPSADAGQNRNVEEGARVELDGSNSRDPEGDPLRYDWHQLGGPAVELTDLQTATPEFTAPSVDDTTTLTFELTVSDLRGQHDADTVAVVVRPVTTEPTAQFQFSPASPNTEDPVQFDGSESRDSDGEIVEYRWDFGDGSTATGQVVSHTYDEPGDYVVTLTVTDDEGTSSQLRRTVGITAVQTAGLKSVNVVDQRDVDGDGRYSAFNLQITADTNCVGCFDEPATGPNIDPYFRVVATDASGTSVTLPRTGEVATRDSLEQLYKVPADRLQGLQAGKLRLRVVLGDFDGDGDDVVDEQTVVVEFEPATEDGDEQTAGIDRVDVVNRVDNDGDGRYSGFGLRITADTNCVGCFDEPAAGPNIDPYFRVVLTDAAGRSINLPRTKEVPTSDNLVQTYTVPRDRVQGLQTGPLQARVVLGDFDGDGDDVVDEQTVVVEFEPATEDGDEQTAGIDRVDVVNRVDNDGDGRYAAFDLRITADTNCLGCFDEPATGPNIDPYFRVVVTDADGDSVVLPPTNEVPTSDDLVQTYTVSTDHLQALSPGTLQVRVVLGDFDGDGDDTVDERTTTLEFEPAREDG